MKILYIVSLGHSGSTYFNFALSDFEKFTSYGEINKTLQKINDDTDLSESKCSCGLLKNNCPFCQN